MSVGSTGQNVVTDNNCRQGYYARMHFRCGEGHGASDKSQEISREIGQQIRRETSAVAGA
jgi:hypothetical protein